MIVTAEEIVSPQKFTDEPEMTAIPGFMVRAVVHAPGGAGPCGCEPLYGVDEAGMRRYMEMSATAEGFSEYLGAAEEPPAQEAPAGG